MSEDIQDINNIEDLLSATVEVIHDKKSANKAKSDIVKRVLSQSGGDKQRLNTVAKAISTKGRAWNGDPLSLNPDERQKDILSQLFIRVFQTIEAFEEFNQTENVLSDYLEALENRGIKITINHEQFNHADTENITPSFEDELDSIKGYIRTVENYSNDLKEFHAPKAEDLNFTPKSEYMRIANIYIRGLAGKEIDDTVQDILLHNELVDSAVNMVADKAKNLNAQVNS